MKSLPPSFKRFWAIWSARNKEFLRDRSALAWNFLFPILVIFGFAFAFSGRSQDVFKVGTVGQAPSGIAASAFLGANHVQFVEEPDLDASLILLSRHQVDMVLQLSPPSGYWINSDSPKGYLLEKILWGMEPDRTRFPRQTVRGREIRYVDWLISGLLAMNMMFSALFGVGYTIVRYRKNGVLKRLKATPLTAFEFLTAQVASRMGLLIGVTVIVYLGSHALVRFQMLGSYATLFLVLVVGAMCLISLGLLVAARIASEEFAGGLLNMISWPMMFLSGVWFSLEGMHPAMKAVAQLFPLTHVIDASRAIMTEGATFAQVRHHIGVLLGMTFAFLGLGSVIFKWE